MLVVRDKAHLQEVMVFAEKIGKKDQLQKKLDYLGSYGGDTDKVRAVLDRDFSPYSFVFSVYRRDPTTGFFDFDKRWFNGGLLYHGSHDSYGSGSAPTFAVTVEPTDGWSIHT